MSTRKDLRVAQTVKNLPEKQETRVWSLGWQVPLEKGMAIHSSILAWRVAWTEKNGGLQSVESQRVGHDWVTTTPVLTREHHSPSASTRVRSLVTAAADLQHTLKGAQDRGQERGSLCSGKTWQYRPSVRYFQKKLGQFLASSPI